MFVLCAILLTSVTFSSSESDWPRFRGPNGDGRVVDQEFPTRWSSEENLRWKAPLPGKGSSSPVVTAEVVYVTAYTGYGVNFDEPGEMADLRRHVIAIDRETGEQLWTFEVKGTENEDPYKGFITQHGYASSSPAVDEDFVFALLGKSGLYALDHEGEEVWHVELGQKSDPAKWGDGTSPIIVDDVVVVDAGILGHKFIGLDRESGEELWSIEDAAFTNAWSTPTTIEIDDERLVLFHVPKRMMAVSPKTGDIVWEVASPIKDATCGCVVTLGLKAFLMGGQAGRGMGIEYDPETSGPKVVWNRNLRAGICTPVLVNDGLYWSSGGIFYGVDSNSGEPLYRERLPRLGGPTGGFPNADYSSPIAVGDHIIQVTRNGETYVIKAADTFELVAHNPAFEGDSSAFSASPAISNGELYLRSENHLYCIAETDAQ